MLVQIKQLWPCAATQTLQNELNSAANPRKNIHYLGHFLVFAMVIAPLVLSAQLGGTWNYRALERNRDGNGVVILNPTTYIVAGGNLTNDTISSPMKTTDTGFTWSLANKGHTPPHNGMITDMDMVSATDGYYVGMGAHVKQTTDAGETWEHIFLPGIGGYRHYRGLEFKDANLGLIVGGNQSSNPQLHDSLQTIVRTSDAGATWAYARDAQGPWLRDVAFAPGTSTWVAVGDSNVILRSTDDGLTWSSIASPLAAGRVLNAVWFNTGEEGFAVGGMPGSWWSPDSITTMLHTTNGGADWSVAMDRSGSMLNDVHFYSTSNGFAVGDHNYVLSTLDGGETWQEEIVTAALVNDYEMNGVRFESPHLGVIVGRQGKCLFYDDPTDHGPVIHKMPVLVLDPNSVKLQVKVNGWGHHTTVTFEYGTTPSLGTAAVAAPGFCGGYDLTKQSTTLTGLQPLQVYYYKAEAINSQGTVTVTGQFQTSTVPQPNFDFEFWNPTTTEVLNDWKWVGDVVRVAGSCDGSSAAEIQAVPGRLEPSIVLYGSIDLASNWVGKPYAARPDSLRACLRYNIAAGDTAMIKLRMTAIASGTLVDTVYRIVGNTGGNFVTQSFKLGYHLPVNPDTLLLAVTSTNVNGVLNPASTLAIDNLVLVNGTQLPGADFESWQTQNRQIPDSWFSLDDEVQHTALSVSQGTEKVHGDYSLKLENLADEYAYLRSGNSETHPRFLVSAQYQSLNGYWRLHSDGNDSLLVTVKMYQGNNLVGSGTKAYTASNLELAPLNVAIDYPNASLVPDSAEIAFEIVNAAHPHQPGASYAILDALSFDGLILHAANEELAAIAAVALYPNPATTWVHLRLDLQKASTVETKIYNMMGQQVHALSLGKLSVGIHETQFDLGMLPAGQYLVQVQAGHQYITKRITLL